MTEKEIKKQVDEMEKLVKEVEGVDDRCYESQVEMKKTL